MNMRIPIMLAAGIIAGMYGNHLPADGPLERGGPEPEPHPGRPRAPEPEHPDVARIRAERLARKRANWAKRQPAKV